MVVAGLGSREDVFLRQVALCWPHHNIDARDANPACDNSQTFDHCLVALAVNPHALFHCEDGHLSLSSRITSSKVGWPFDTSKLKEGGSARTPDGRTSTGKRATIGINIPRHRPIDRNIFTSPSTPPPYSHSRCDTRWSWEYREEGLCNSLATCGQRSEGGAR